MIINPHQGLGNRLENVFGVIGKARSKGEAVTLVWINNDECSGSFYECFQPIVGLEISSSCSTEASIHSWELPTAEEYRVMSSSLKLTVPLLTEVERWKEKMGYDYISLHVRKTDFVPYIKATFNIDVSSNERYFDFIGSHPNNTRIFLATDNPTDQLMFKKKYGSRVFFKQIFPSISRRKTSLQDAAIDMFVCAGAKDFKGTRGSSFTKTILALRMEIDKAMGPEYNQRYECTRETNQT